jgi:tetratricopeptide (TPR) repeat protein
MTNEQAAFKQSMDKGSSAAWDQRWEDAAEHYREALEEVPDHFQALMSLGLALYESQNFADALVCYERATQIQPDDAAPVDRIAQIYELTGDSQQSAKHSITAADMYLNVKDADKAIENWTRVIHLFPEHLAAHSRLALVHERLGRRPQAITEYLAVASLQQHEGKQQEALETINHAMKLNPKSKEAAQALEMLNANKMLTKPTGQRGAEGPLQMAKAKQKRPQSEMKVEQGEKDTADPITEASQRALAILAEMLFQAPDEGLDEGPASRGLKSMDKGVTTSLMAPGPDRTKVFTHLGKAIDLHTRGEIDQSAEEIKQAISFGFDHPAAYYLLGHILYKSDRKESALRSLQRAVTHSELALAVRLLIGEHMLERNKLRGAAREYLEALKIADSSVVSEEYRDELAQVYEPIIETHSKGKDKDVLSKLCIAISDLLIQPNWRINLIETREQLPQTGNSSSPAPIVELLTQPEGSLVVEALTKINHLAREGFYRTAMEEAFAVLEHAPTYLPLHIQMGELLLRQDRNQDAIIKFTTVAEAYGARGEANRATDLYRRIVALSPMDLGARNSLIDQLITRGDVDNALEEYVKLSEAYYRLAELDMARATLEKALRVAQQSNLEDNWNVQILHNMADIDLQRLNWRRALRVFEQLRTLDPGDEKARRNLIELNLHMGNEVQSKAELDNYISFLVGNAQEDDALLFLEVLFEDNPNMVFVRRRLAKLYQQAARVDDAVEQWDKLGEMLLESGDRDGAIEAVQAIVNLSPSNVDKYRKILEMLSQG